MELNQISRYCLGRFGEGVTIRRRYVYYLCFHRAVCDQHAYKLSYVALTCIKRGYEKDNRSISDRWNQTSNAVIIILFSTNYGITPKDVCNLTECVGGLNATMNNKGNKSDRITLKRNSKSDYFLQQYFSAKLYYLRKLSENSNNICLQVSTF